MDRTKIQEIFMKHGFTIKEGQTDLKDYVYEAAEALLVEHSREVMKVVEQLDKAVHSTIDCITSVNNIVRNVEDVLK